MNSNKPLFYGMSNIHYIPFERSSLEYKNAKSFLNNIVLAHFTNNAYRILDLSITASESEIITKVNTISRKTNLGIDITSVLGLDLINDLIIDEKKLTSAKNHLLSANERYIERVFWFKQLGDWPLNNLLSKYMMLKDYLAFFYSSLDAFEQIPIIQFYSLAQMGTIYLTVDDPQLDCIYAWVDVINLALYIYKQQKFWVALDTIENNGSFSQKCLHNPEIIKEITTKLINPIQYLAERHLDNGDKRVFNAIHIVNKLNLSDAIKSKIANQLIDRIEDYLVSIQNKILDDNAAQLIQTEEGVSHNKEVCESAYKLFKEKVEPMYIEFINIVDVNARVKRIQEHTAKFYMFLANQFTWANDYITAKFLLKKAKPLVADESIYKEQINHNLNSIEPMAEFQKLNKTNKNNNAREKVSKKNASNIYWLLALIGGIVVYFVIITNQ